MKNEHKNAIEEKVRIRLEYNFTSKQFNYTVLACILSVFGYSHYAGDDIGKEVNRPDNAYRVVVNEKLTQLRHDVDSVRVDIRLATSIMTKQNLELIKKVTQE